MTKEQLQEDIKDLDIAIAQASEDVRVSNEWYIQLIDKKIKLVEELNGNN